MEGKDYCDAFVFITENTDIKFEKEPTQAFFVVGNQLLTLSPSYT